VKQRHRHRHAGLHARHALRDFFYDACGLVTWRQRERAGPITVDHVDVAVANARRGQARLHLACLRGIELHLFDL
jgi:hypothetical protein